MAEKTLGSAIDQALQALGGLPEKEQEIAIMTVCSVLGIGKVLARATIQEGAHAAAAAASSPARTPIQDIRALKEQRNPSSARQMACLVAYYLQELAASDERKAEVSAADLEKYFKQANYELPRKMKQVLIDCKSAGYLDSVRRGVYRLNAVGYNLAAHGKMGAAKDD
jgi:hypothetical protein